MSSHILHSLAHNITCKVTRASIPYSRCSHIAALSISSISLNFSSAPRYFGAQDVPEQEEDALSHSSTICNDSFNKILHNYHKLKVVLLHIEQYCTPFVYCPCTTYHSKGSFIYVDADILAVAIEPATFIQHCNHYVITLCV